MSVGACVPGIREHARTARDEGGEMNDHKFVALIAVVLIAAAVFIVSNDLREATQRTERTRVSADLENELTWENQLVVDLYAATSRMYQCESEIYRTAKAGEVCRDACAKYDELIYREAHPPAYVKDFRYERLTDRGRMCDRNFPLKAGGER
jgi:hypothetical protein